MENAQVPSSKANVAAKAIGIGLHKLMFWVPVQCAVDITQFQTDYAQSAKTAEIPTRDSFACERQTYLPPKKSRT